MVRGLSRAGASATEPTSARKLIGVAIVERVRRGSAIEVHVDRGDELRFGLELHRQLFRGRAESHHAPCLRARRQGAAARYRSATCAAALLSLMPKPVIAFKGA